MFTFMIIQRRTDMSNDISVLIDKIYKAEGSVIHRNATETDITSPGGIYRTANPNATIWSYIDSVAKKLSITKPSSEWSSSDISKVNSNLNPAITREHVTKFYTEYMSKAKMDLVPDVLAYTLFNIYTNSVVGYWSATQDTLLDLQANKIINIDKKELSIVDGAPGAKTYNGMKLLNSIPKSDLKYVQAILCSNAKTFYAKLVARNPDKYLIYLNGWMKRMDMLEHEVGTW